MEFVCVNVFRFTWANKSTCARAYRHWYQTLNEQTDKWQYYRINNAVQTHRLHFIIFIFDNWVWIEWGVWCVGLCVLCVDWMIAFIISRTYTFVCTCSSCSKIVLGIAVTCCIENQLDPSDLKWFNLIAWNCELRYVCEYFQIKRTESCMGVGSNTFYEYKWSAKCYRGSVHIYFFFSFKNDFHRIKFTFVSQINTIKA